MKRVPDKYKGLKPIPTHGGTQRLSVVSEEGLYRLVLRCDKPEAEPFIDGEPWFVAKETVKRHADVMRDIRNLIDQRAINESSFALVEYADAKDDFSR